MLKVTESLPLKSALKFNPSMEIFYGTLALDSHAQKAVILIVRIQHAKNRLNENLEHHFPNTSSALT